MARGRRRGTKVNTTDSESAQSSSSSRTSADDSVDFDPDKLSIILEGQWKSFNEWTLEYAGHYYPEVGHKTYRVPPLDFNTQSLTDVAPLDFAELQAPKEETRKKDRSQADVGTKLEELGRRLENTTEGGQRGRGLFVVSSAHYENYLSDLKNLRTKGTKHPPLPREVAQRGELDFLVLHSQEGIVLVQVKGVGFPDSWRPTEAQLQAAVRKKVKEALDQLARDEVVLQHVMRDLNLQCHVHNVVALPFVTVKLLTDSLPTKGEADEDQPEIVYLCTEHMSSNDAMFSWWSSQIVRENNKPLDDFQLQSIVGRYCGLMSTVSVWCKSSLRVEVRDVAEAADEVGNRFANLVLTAQQREALDCPQNLMYLHGPPGTGKSVLMVIKARQWLLQGHDVIILNLDFGRPGNPVGHYIHDSIRQWLLKSFGDESTGSSLAKASGGKSKPSTGRDRRKRSKGPPKDTFTGSTENADTESHSPNPSASKEETECDSTTKVSLSAHTMTPEPKASDTPDSPEADTGSATLSSCSTSLSSSSDAEISRQGDIGQVFRIDFDLGMNLGDSQAQQRIQELMQQVKQTVRPGIPCHFVVDEFYWKDRLVPVVEQIRHQFPDSCIWCAEVSGDRVPPLFTPFMLKTVLRCPPTVQTLLKKLDWMKTHSDLYMGDSTLLGLPTDGFKPRLLEHKYHSALSPLDCVQCADMLLTFFLEELKLEFGEGARSAEAAILETPPKSNDYLPDAASPLTSCNTSSSPTEDSSSTSQHPQQTPQKKTLPVPKTKKKRTYCLPRRVKFSDIVVLFSYPKKCLNSAKDLFLVEDKPQDIHHDNIENSVFFRHMKKAGLPSLFREPNSDAREIALPTEDRVLFSVTSAVTGLERKVVVYVPCESTRYEYPVIRKHDHHTEASTALHSTSDPIPPSSSDVAPDLSANHPVNKDNDSVGRHGENGNDSSTGLAIPVTAGLSAEDWEKIDDRILDQNQKGLFYAASRCLSVLVVIIP